MESSIDYQELIALISARMGLVFNEHREKLLRGALSQILSADLTLPALVATLAVEKESHPTWRIIVQALTVGETYFYRNQAHLKALYSKVLPELIEQRRSKADLRLRIWSAGCATGEEPYSLAMMLHDLLPDIDSWSIDLLGTDINEEFLERARAGFYRSHAFRGETPDWLQRRWFEVRDDGFELLPEIRRMVRFASLNLVTDEYPMPGMIDIVLCRNVTIYFEREQTQKVINRIYDVLGAGGWLVVGHSEPQPEVYDAFVMRNFENAIFYQKAAHDTPAARPVHVAAAPESSLLAFLPTSSAANSIVPEMVAEADPEPVGVELLGLAVAAANSEDWDEAFRLLEQVERADVLLPQLHYLRGLIHMQMSNLQSASESLRQALYCDPSFALAHYSLGELRERTGEVVAARRHWQRARNVLAQRDPQELLPFGDDLTVEMLNGLLDYRLQESC